MTEMKIDTTFPMVEYVMLVEGIVKAYFDDEGRYQPHIGAINAMRMFYNLCVKECKFDEKYPHEIVDILEMDEIIHDDEFLAEFDKAIEAPHGFDFGSALRQAMDMVETRKNSFANLGEVIKGTIHTVVDELKEVFTEENIELFEKIAGTVKQGGIDENAIVQAYINSQTDKNEFEEENAEEASN